MMIESRFGRAIRLECRFDGPILPSDPTHFGQPAASARGVLFQRLAGEQRHALARRRAGLTAAELRADDCLGRAARSLRYYRDQGAAWL
jgi:hypothetical protein